MSGRDLLNAMRAGYGAGLLLLPRGALARLARMPLDSLDVTVARVLGVRQLVQAAVLHRRPDLAGPGAVVDGLHAASMMAVSRLDHDMGHRTLAARDARSAGLLTLLGLVLR
jgi:hypothetical protein